MDNQSYSIEINERRNALLHALIIHACDSGFREVEEIPEEIQMELDNLIDELSENEHRKGWCKDPRCPEKNQTKPDNA